RTDFSYACVTGSAGIHFNQLTRFLSQVQKRSCGLLPFFVIISLYIGNMQFPGTMTGFAAYIDHAVTGVIAVSICIIIFLKIGTMATGTHCIPVLCIACPVEPVVRRNMLSGIL